MVYRNNIIRAAIIGTVIVVGIILCILFLVEDKNTKQSSASSLLLEDNDIISSNTSYTKQQVYISDSNDFDLLSFEQPSDAEDTNNNNDIDTIVNVSFEGQERPRLYCFSVINMKSWRLGYSSYLYLPYLIAFTSHMHSNIC